MAWQFNDRLDRLGVRKKELDYVAVTYTRSGLGTSASINATMAVSIIEQEVPNVYSVRVRTQDFIVDADELVISATTITPERGDIITLTSSGEEFTVCEEDLGFPPWDYTTTSKARIRIHTKKTDDG